MAKEEQATAVKKEEKMPEEVAVEGEGKREGESEGNDTKKGRESRQLVKDERCQAGAVKWNISTLVACLVPFCTARADIVQLQLLQ